MSSTTNTTTTENYPAVQSTTNTTTTENYPAVPSTTNTTTTTENYPGGCFNQI